MQTKTLNFIEPELNELKEKGLYKNIRTIQSAQGAWVEIEGRRVLNFCSNNYLGFAADERIKAAAKGAIDKYGVGPGAVRTIAGTMTIHEELERELAKFKGVEACLTVQSGLIANMCAIPALVGKEDTIVSDELNHASIIDGMMLSGAEFRRYRHLDYGHLEEMLKERAGGSRRVLVVSESVYSMDGDVADLRILVDLCRKYGAILYIDEAHSVGVRGIRGAGCCEEAGVIDEVDIIIGTLGKAFCSAGAFAIVRPELKDYLINHTRPFIFTTGLPPVNINWTRFILNKMPAMRKEREHLAALGEYLRDGLSARGLKTFGSSQIVPLIVGENGPAEELAGKLRDGGFLALPVRPPTVPAGTARLRFSLHADLKQEQLSDLLELL